MMIAEDYRVKNAREGKAIYIPGQSVEEMRETIASERATKAKAEGKGQKSIIDLTEAEWNAIDTGIPDIVTSLYGAKNVFDHLADGMASGFLDQKDSLIGSISRLTAKALGNMETKEFEALDMLGGKLRHVAAEYARLKIQTEMQGGKVT